MMEKTDTPKVPALPTDPSPPGSASIPDARDFEVIADAEVGRRGGYQIKLHGEVIAEVRRVFRTIEKAIKGKRYVAWRRTAKTATYQVYWPREGYRGRAYHHRTLRDAVQSSIAQAIEARSGETGTGSIRKDESAVHAPKGTTHDH